MELKRVKRNAGILVLLWTFISLCTCVLLPQGHECCLPSSKTFDPKQSRSTCHANTPCCRQAPVAALQAGSEKLPAFGEAPDFFRTLTAVLKSQADAIILQSGLAQAFVANQQTRRYLELCVLLN